MRNDSNETRAIGAGLTIGHDNARDFSAHYGIIITVEGRLSPDRLERTHNMTMIFLASDSSDTLAFSNIGTALDYVRDSHGDLNPEGCLLPIRLSKPLVTA